MRQDEVAGLVVTLHWGAREQSTCFTGIDEAVALLLHHVHARLGWTRE